MIRFCIYFRSRTDSVCQWKVCEVCGCSNQGTLQAGALARNSPEWRVWLRNFIFRSVIPGRWQIRIKKQHEPRLAPHGHKVGIAWNNPEMDSEKRKNLSKGSNYKQS